MCIRDSLSCLQLEDPTLVEYLAQTLREEGVSAEHILSLIHI